MTKKNSYDQHKLMRRDALFFGNRQEVGHRLFFPDKLARRAGRTTLAFYYAPGLDVVGLASYSLPASDWPCMPEAFLAAVLLSIAQSVLFFARERTFKAFPVELRLAYTLLLTICLLPPMRWLYWLPAVGTSALVIFGYCLLARMLSLLPWNRAEPITVDLLRRTFLSRPRLPDRAHRVSSAGCGAGLCSIEAQVEPGTNSRRSTLT